MATTNQQRVQADIEQYGLHIIHVLGDEDGPRFSYSIGLFHTYNHPEIIIVGLRHELAHQLLNDMAYAIESGQPYAPHQFYHDVIDGYACYMLPVDAAHYSPYVGQAQRYYGDRAFPVLQCVYPSVAGVYPWQPSAPTDFTWFEPLLGEPNQEAVRHTL